MKFLNPKEYYLISASVFGFVSLVHWFRLINHTIMILGSWHVPVVFSVFAAVAAGYLSYQGFLLAGVIKK